MRFNLTNFETVCCIADAGSFAAAAARLHASQPAVSARVRELESQVGFPFFQKRGRRMELTPQARGFIERVRPLASGIEQELAAFADPVGLRGSVRLGIAPAMLGWFPRVLARLQPDLPGVRYDIEVGAGSTMVRQLLAGQLDLALVAGDPAASQLQAVALQPEEIQWLVRAGDARALRRQPLPAVLETVPVWLAPPTSTLFPPAIAALHRHHPAPRHLNHCTHMDAILRLVEQVGGLGLVATCVAEEALHAGSVVPASAELPALLLPVTMLARRGAQQPIVHRLTEAIVEVDRAREPVRAGRRQAVRAGRGRTRAARAPAA